MGKERIDKHKTEKFIYKLPPKLPGTFTIFLPECVKLVSCIGTASFNRVILEISPFKSEEKHVEHIVHVIKKTKNIGKPNSKTQNVGTIEKNGISYNLFIRKV